MSEATSLYDVFAVSANTYPEAPAVDVEGRCHSYHELKLLAANIGRAVLRCQNDPEPVAAFLAYRSLNTYISVLGILAAGKGYVPLHPHFPTVRTVQMLLASGARVLILGGECSEIAKEVLARVDRRLSVLCLGFDSSSLQQHLPQHEFFTVQLDPVDVRFEPVRPAADDIAYLLFTSGSTGIPKGVPIQHRNVLSYLQYVQGRYGIDSHDKCSQTFDVTFDLSVHDQFLCWSAGACLCCLPRKALLAPARFIREKELTVWFSVPSLAMMMSRMRMLKHNLFPSLRLSLFCGEALPATAAQSWQDAAPNSVIENIYGPTETTIAVSHYRWNQNMDMSRFPNGIVPIGDIFTTHRGCIIDPEGRPVGTDSEGELCIAGPQVAVGYLSDVERTRERFIKIPATGETTWYRTGDLVRQDPVSNCLYYLGRVDDQVQICGFRVELQEVDAALRRAAGTDIALTVAWPLCGGRADAIYGFVSAGEDASAASIRAACCKILPEYMIPKEVFLVPDIPRNANGKLDRGALAKMLEAQIAS